MSTQHLIDISATEPPINAIVLGKNDLTIAIERSAVINTLYHSKKYFLINQFPIRKFLMEG
jgi:hypothetical protein